MKTKNVNLILKIDLSVLSNETFIRWKISIFDQKLFECKFSHLKLKKSN